MKLIDRAFNPYERRVRFAFKPLLQQIGGKGNSTLRRRAFWLGRGEILR